MTARTRGGGIDGGSAGGGATAAGGGRDAAGGGGDALGPRKPAMLPNTSSILSLLSALYVTSTLSRLLHDAELMIVRLPEKPVPERLSLAFIQR
jgi:hypothetical protein